MAEFIEVLSPSALKDLQNLNSEIVKTIAGVKEVNSNMISIKTPSGSDSALKSLNAEYKKQEKLLQDAQKLLIKEQQERKKTVQAILDQAKSYQGLEAQKAKAIAQSEKEAAAMAKFNAQKDKGNKLTQQEKTDIQILNSERKRESIISSQVAGEYRKLSAQVAIASEKYQNLMVRGRLANQSQVSFNKELKIAQDNFRNLQTRVLSADKAVDKWNRTNERTIALGRDLLSAFGVVGGVTAFAMITKDIFNQTKEIQSLNNALKQVTDTTSNYYTQQAFLQQTSQDLGLDINSLTKQFTQFYVSAKDKISSKEIQDIFRSVAKAGSIMGLSVEQQERAFLALNQMMSKGVVSAEELRGQLGEALPGAFGIMAKALNINEQQLGKMMKDGKLLATDVLPKFAKQLEKTYGIENITRVDNLASAQNRLSNSWRNFVASLDSDGNKLSNFFQKILNVATKIVEGTELIFSSSATKRQNELKKIGEFAYKTEKETLENMDEAKKQNAITEREYVRDRIIDIKNEIQVIKDRNKELEKSKDGTFGTEVKVRRAQIENNKALYALNNSLQYNIGTRKALDEVLVEETKKTDINTEAKKKNTEATKKLNEQENIKIFTERYFENEISKLEEIRKKVADTTLEYASYTNQINVLKLLLEQLRGIENPDTLRKEQLEALDEGIKKMKNYEENVVKTKEETTELRKATDEWIKSFSEGFFSDAGLPTMFKILNGEIEGFGENFTETFLAISQAAQEAFKFISDASNANFQNEYANLQKQKEVALLFAGDSVAAKEEIEKQAEVRRKQIARREFQAKKQQALFNITIDTAQAIVAALPNIPLSIAIGAIGAIQLALVSSQQAPQFWTGTDNAPEGLAWTQERGREIITDKYGKIKTTGSDKGAQLTYLNKGDKVLNNEKTMDYLMFNNDLNGILTNNNISQPSIEVNNSGLTDSQVGKIVYAIESKAEFSQLISNGDLKTVVRKNNQETEVMNRRINFKGKSI